MLEMLFWNPAVDTPLFSESRNAVVEDLLGETTNSAMVSKRSASVSRKSTLISHTVTQVRSLLFLT
jgi:hypothetical protein